MRIKHYLICLYNACGGFCFKPFYEDRSRLVNMYYGWIWRPEKITKRFVELYKKNLRDLHNYNL
ncbi:hypothetical protein LCGC14_1609830 [marine sediment metagenome]|uniref:Uncharacterized protein n=1 Tax=marine sediment metagenome TaxID=412755 RepID=A0A0F9I8M3_9ZZZZ